MVNEDEKCVVAQAINLMGSSAEQGTMLGEFRKPEFARKARVRVKAEAAKRGIRNVGIFQKKKFIELL